MDAPQPTTFTPATLGSVPRGGTLLAVLGWPVRHSVSPAMHGAALAEMAATDPRFASWAYHRVEVEPGTLPEVLPRLHAAGFHGLNLTLPHKVDAVPLVERVDPAASRFGAVNTLRRTATGWEGFSTDGFGLARSLGEELGLGFAGRDVVVLGAGGAGRAAAVQALDDGARSVVVLNRSLPRLEALAEVLRGLPGAAGRWSTGPLDAVPEGLGPGAIVVNATSGGLKETAPPVDLTAWPRPAAVVDMIYNPTVPPLVDAARALGIPAANGLGMLVWQGVRALELWSGARVPAAAMRRGAERALGLA